MTSPRLPYVAALRLYQPLEALPQGEQGQWEDYLDRWRRADGRPTRREVMAAELAQQRARVLTAPASVVPEEESGQAYVLVVDGTTLVCPVQTRLRSLAALLSFASDLPAAVAALFLPTAAPGDDADAGRPRPTAEGAAPTGERVLTLTETWTVPLHWFVAFAAEERRLDLDAPGRDLVYRAPVVRARRRLQLAARALRVRVPQGPVAAGVADLLTWLGDAHPEAVLELDYAGLAHLVTSEALAQDHSARDMGEAVAALGRGEAQVALAAYTRLVERWRAVAMLEHAS